MSDQAVETPLTELMAAIPKDAVLQWTDPDGLKASHSAPVGLYIHRALAAITARDTELRALRKRNTDLLDDIRHQQKFSSEVLRQDNAALRTQLSAIAKDARWQWRHVKTEPPPRLCDVLTSDGNRVICEVGRDAKQWWMPMPDAPDAIDAALPETESECQHSWHAWRLVDQRDEPKEDGYVVIETFECTMCGYRKITNRWEHKT